MLFSSPFAWLIPKHHYLISYYLAFCFLVLYLFFCVFMFLQRLSPPTEFKLHWSRRRVGLQCLSIQSQYMPIFPKWRSEHFNPFSKLLKIINVNRCYYHAFSWPIVKSHILILALKIVFNEPFASFIQNICMEHLLRSRHYSRTKHLSSFVFLPLGAKSSSVQNILSTLATRVLATTNGIPFFPYFCLNSFYCLQHLPILCPPNNSLTIS